METIKIKSILLRIGRSSSSLVDTLTSKTDFMLINDIDESFFLSHMIESLKISTAACQC